MLQYPHDFRRIKCLSQITSTYYRTRTHFYRPLLLQIYWRDNFQYSGCQGKNYIILWVLFISVKLTKIPPPLSSTKYRLRAFHHHHTDCFFVITFFRGLLFYNIKQDKTGVLLIFSVFVPFSKSSDPIAWDAFWILKHFWLTITTTTFLRASRVASSTCSNCHLKWNKNIV